MSASYAPPCSGQRETFYDCVRILGEELYPALKEDERMVELGTAFMDGFEQTLIGTLHVTWMP